MADKILKFSASWCGPCQALKMSLVDVDLGVPVEDVDIDQNTELAVQYGVRSVPTMVRIRDGVEVDRLVGVKPVDEIRKWLES